MEPTKRNIHKLHKFYGLLMVFISVCFVLLSLELMTRYFIPQLTAPRFFLPEPFVIKVGTPNIDGIINFPDIYRYRIVNDSEGYRVPPEKRFTGTNRVVFLGDSFTWGMGVNEEMTFAGLTRTYLQGAFEVINASMPGSGPTYALATYERRIRTKHPVLVFFGLFLANDLSDVIIEKLYDFEADGNSLKFISHNRDFRGPVRRWLNNLDTYNWLGEHSHLFSLVRKLVMTPPEIFQAPANIKDDDASERKENREGLELCKAALRELNNVCKKDGCKLVIVLIPHYYELVNGDARHWRVPRTELSEMAKQNNIEFINLIEPFQNLLLTRKASDIYFPNEGHFRSLGHMQTFLSIQPILDELLQEYQRQQ